MIPPSAISGLEYDYLVIALSQYAEPITEALVRQYGVDARKIRVFRPEIPDLACLEERVVMLRKCVATLLEREVPGNMAEVGVYRGEFARLMNRFLPDRKLYLFDTFTGFDARDGARETDVQNFKDTAIQDVLARMPYPGQCIVRQGYFPDTANGLEDRFALVSLDCDLYRPILAGLRYFYPRLEKGGYIFVHDFGSTHYDRVKQAVYEFCAEQGAAVVPIVDRCLSAIITK